MPGKSKHKKFRQSSGKKANVLQTSMTTTAAQPATAGALSVSKPFSASAKTAPPAGKQSGAQYTADQFKYVGTELKVAGILSGIILTIIIILYFVLH
ncbi:MAG: hypothetical protein NTX46_00950 [Chloroflexi bacterium]|nr:hypothetical protein [Chloroflexota bacterium]